MGQYEGKVGVTKGKGAKSSSDETLAKKGHLTFGKSGSTSGTTGLSGVTGRGKQYKK